MDKIILIVLLFIFISLNINAQQYTGITGLLHVPSAEMNAVGDARIGVHFINKHQVPNEGFSYNGSKYNTFSYYVSLTPFSWIELGYTCTLLKQVNSPVYDGHGYEEKDRYFSLKLRPLKEGRWYPAIVIGCNDISDSYSFFNFNDNAVESYFGNYYISATKHFFINQDILGFHLTYRHYVRKFNSKWNGIVGGITYRPSFVRNVRAIVEFTGSDINWGFDSVLWKYLLLQISFQKGMYFSGGICFQINIL